MEMGIKAGEDGHVPVICGLVRCNKWDIDESWEAVRHARRPRVHTFIATSEIHLQHKLRKTREEFVTIARKMFAYARSLGFHDIEFSPEDAGRLYSILCIGELTGLNAKCASTLMAQHLLTAADRYALERLRLLCELSFV